MKRRTGVVHLSVGNKYLIPPWLINICRLLSVVKREHTHTVVCRTLVLCLLLSVSLLQTKACCWHCCDAMWVISQILLWWVFVWVNAFKHVLICRHVLCAHDRGICFWMRLWRCLHGETFELVFFCVFYSCLSTCWPLNVNGVFQQLNSCVLECQHILLTFKLHGANSFSVHFLYMVFSNASVYVDLSCWSWYLCSKLHNVWI